MILRILLYGLLAYIAFKFIFNFVIPLFIAGKKIRKGFREMHERMEEQMNQQPGSQTEPQKTSPKPASSDYIDFEEVK